MSAQRPSTHGSRRVLLAPAFAALLTSAPVQSQDEPVPRLTDADRAAAFPEISAHAAHGTGLHSYMLFDRLEAWDADPGTGLAWDALGWFGSDLDRLWLRSEGERIDGATETADVELLYGRAVARWCDLVGGVRHDFGAGPSQTFAGIGVIGLAPYKFEVEATAYVGESGQSAARFEIEYDMLLTNRLIAQWRADADLYGKDDPDRGLSSGLSTLEAGVRVRYEITRRFAPFIGVAWERAYGGTADLRRKRGEDVDDTRLVAGLRAWF
jgi:copper resistance protein B